MPFEKYIPTPGSSLVGADGDYARQEELGGTSNMRQPNYRLQAEGGLRRQMKNSQMMTTFHSEKSCVDAYESP